MSQETNPFVTTTTYGTSTVRLCGVILFLNCCVGRIRKIDAAPPIVVAPDVWYIPPLARHAVTFVGPCEFIRAFHWSFLQCFGVWDL